MQMVWYRDHGFARQLLPTAGQPSLRASSNNLLGDLPLGRSSRCQNDPEPDCKPSVGSSELSLCSLMCVSLRLPIEDVGSPNSYTDDLKMLKALDQRSFHDLEQTMPKSINKVILVGNVGADPEIKYTPSGIPVGKFSLATNECFKNKSGEWQDRTEWHNIVAWQRLAEIVGEYVSKGSKVYIEGKLQTSCWEDRRSGEKKYRTEIVARDLVLLGLRENCNSKQEHATSGEQREPDDAGSGEITNEDIPF
jgi:single-strand DNA-binding protein